MENINALDELNKGSTMGMEAIHFIIDKVEDEEFKNVLVKEYKKYESIAKKISEIYPNYSDKLPHKVNVMNKAMTWGGIEMETIMDKSNSKIAELLIKGTNMGIIEGRKLLNNKDIDNRINDLISEFVKMQEESVEILKEYL